MPSQLERSLVARSFAGVDLLTDPAFLSLSMLQRAENFVPDTTFLLLKRNGNTLQLQRSVGSISRFDNLLRTYDSAGNRYLFGVITETNAGFGDGIYVQVNDTGTLALVPNGRFASKDQRVGFVVLGGKLYAGNGIDPIKSIPLGGTAVDLTTQGNFQDTSAAIVVAGGDANSKIESGVYSFTWMVFNKVTKQFTQRGWNDAGFTTTRTLQVNQATSSALSFPVPSVGNYSLQTNEVFRLFVTEPNDPIEFAHDQTPNGHLSADAAVVLAALTPDSTPLPLTNVQRQGRFFTAHKSRVWFAGDQTHRSTVYATGTIVPGLEQPIYDLGDFFPANAQIRVRENDGDEVTALAVVTASTAGRNPSVPLAIFKNGSVWLWFGDILDDDTAQLVQVSDRIGCIAHATAINTPVGVVFCGTDSVYLLPLDLSEPVDIGQAISPAIRAIPTGRRAFATATYHRGFYKLAITPTGGVKNTQQWFLDLRPQFRSGNPAWWGPQTMVATAAMTVGLRDTVETERLYIAQDRIASDGNANAQVYFGDQAGQTTDDGGIITARLRTARMVDGDPFLRKTVTRVRAIGRPTAPTAMATTVMTDGESPVAQGPMNFIGASGTLWDSAVWDQSQWGSLSFVEAEFIMPSERPRGQSIEVELVHADQQGIALRDLEVRYLPVDRPVQVYKPA